MPVCGNTEEFSLKKNIKVYGPTKLNPSNTLNKPVPLTL